MLQKYEKQESKIKNEKLKLQKQTKEYETKLEELIDSKLDSFNQAVNLINEEVVVRRKQEQ